MVSGGVHITTPPVIGSSPQLRGHAFWNFGNLVQWTKSELFREL
jgi:hypothetical protein